MKYCRSVHRTNDEPKGIKRAAFPSTVAARYRGVFEEEGHDLGTRHRVANCTYRVRIICDRLGTGSRRHSLFQPPGPPPVEPSPDAPYNRRIYRWRPSNNRRFGSEAAPATRKSRCRGSCAVLNPLLRPLFCREFRKNKKKKKEPGLANGD